MIPIALEGIFILLSPERKEGPMDIYSIGLMPGLGGAMFLSHLRLLNAISQEMKKSLQEYAQKETDNAQPE